MPEPLLKKEDVARLLNVSEPTVDRYVESGIITRLKIPAVRFSTQEIYSLMKLDSNMERFSPLERKKMQQEIEDLKQENKNLKAIFSRMKMFIAETEYTECKEKEG